jgi:hypothetical protein
VATWGNEMIRGFCQAYGADALFRFAGGRAAWRRQDDLFQTLEYLGGVVRVSNSQTNLGDKKQARVCTVSTCFGLEYYLVHVLVALDFVNFCRLSELGHNSHQLT